MVAIRESYISSLEYLANEEVAETKHEYINGYIYAMVGASDNHVTITGNIFAALHNHLRNNSCRVYASDMKVNIATRNCYYYPDVMVTCNDRDRSSNKYKQYPCLIVEVLYDSTEALDRGRKFDNYQQLETLKEYVLIDQNTELINCFRRVDGGLWLLESYRSGSTLKLQSVGLDMPITDIYSKVDISPQIDS